jgi:hypothetical protein
VNNSDLNKIRDDAKIKEAAQRLEIERRHKEMDAQTKTAKERLTSYCIPVDVREYSKWLKEYLAIGGEITCVYDYPMDRIYMATADFELLPLYGASSVSLILPRGIKIIGEHGHIEVFDFNTMTPWSGRVPLYSNVKIDG